MTKDDIIRMAREAGICIYNNDDELMLGSPEELERFAALVAAAEREACAKVVDEMADQMVADMEPSTAVAWVRNRAAAIRARGQA